MEKVKNSILSFDVPSVCTGWSYFEDGKLRELGKIKMPKKEDLTEEQLEVLEGI